MSKLMIAMPSDTMRTAIPSVSSPAMITAMFTSPLTTFRTAPIPADGFT